MMVEKKSEITWDDVDFDDDKIMIGRSWIERERNADAGRRRLTDCQAEREKKNIHWCICMCCVTECWGRNSALTTLSLLHKRCESALSSSLSPTDNTFPYINNDERKEEEPATKTSLSLLPVEGETASCNLLHVLTISLSLSLCDEREVCTGESHVMKGKSYDRHNPFPTIFLSLRFLLLILLSL